MKKLYVLFLVVGFVTFAETANHDSSKTDTNTRSETEKVADKTKRLFELISACSPGAQGVGQAITPPPTTQPPTGSADGQAAYQSKCLSCHSSNGHPLEGKSGADLLSHLNSDMPKAGSEQAKTITQAEKDALKVFFQSK